MRNIVIITVILVASKLFAVDINKCNLPLTKKSDTYVNTIVEKLYYSIVENFEEHGGKLKFAAQRFPFQLQFSLEKAQLFKDSSISLGLVDILGRKGLPELEKISTFYKPFINQIKNKIESNPLYKDKITIYAESAFSILPFSPPHFSFYADIHILKSFLKDLLENPISSPFGNYDLSKIVFDTIQYPKDLKSFGDKGTYEALNKEDWFESPQHHEVMRGHKNGLSHESIASSLNFFEETMVDIPENRINFTPAIIQKTIDFEIYRTKEFRSKGWIYFKNKYGQSRFNVADLENIISNLYKEKGKDLGEIVEALNDKMNQLPYNRYLFVPWTEQEVINLIEHKLNSSKLL